MLAVFLNIGFFPCLDPRCHQIVDLTDVQVVSVRLDMIALKIPSETDQTFLAKLTLLCFCSKHRKEPMHEDEIHSKLFEGLFRIEDVSEERGKETGGEMAVRELRRELKKAKQEEEREVSRLLDEVKGLKEQLQRTVNENGMLEQRIAADEQRSIEKQMMMSGKIFQLQKQVSEVE